ncbi:MAG TPA: crotonase/enoyl-CoA hydratase family protein [Myxococcota bacterium]|jgi:enoyl-CoA hydratase/carnithine racemase
MAYETILVDKSEGIQTITFNRPDRLNALNGQMLLDTLAALDDADADDSIRAIIFTGAGRGFCAGADLGAGGGTFDHTEREQRSEHRDGGGLLTLRIFECRKPVIAAINGPAVGVGSTMTLPMDVRIASDQARFGFVFARRGIVPEAASSYFLPRVVGISQAMEWVATGRVFSAQEALAGRLVSRVVPHAELTATARALAREIADNTSSISVTLSRQMLWRMLGADHPMEAHKLDSRMIHATGSSADAREGVQSFLEKRPAKFTMRVSKDLPQPYPWWPERKFSDAAPKPAATKASRAKPARRAKAKPRKGK